MYIEQKKLTTSIHAITIYNVILHTSMFGTCSVEYPKDNDFHFLYC